MGGKGKGKRPMEPTPGDNECGIVFLNSKKMWTCACDDKQYEHLDSAVCHNSKCDQETMIAIQKDQPGYQPASMQDDVQEDDPTLEVGDSATHAFTNAPAFIIKAFVDTDSSDKPAMEELLKRYMQFMNAHPTIKAYRWASKLRKAMRNGTVTTFMSLLEENLYNEQRIHDLMT